MSAARGAGFAVQNKPAEPVDPMTAAIEAHAAAVEKLAAEVAAHTAQREPVDLFFKEATEALLCFRAFLKKWGPWMLAAAPVALALVQGVSPSLAKALAAWLAAMPTG